MTQNVNRQWRLASRPTDKVEDRHFHLTEEPIPTVTADGEVLIRNLYLSVDPTQRGWMARDTYLPAIPIGDVVRSLGAGRVVESRNPSYAAGDLVAGMVGWQDYALLDAKTAKSLSKIPPGVPIELGLSLFGGSGLTAYFGLLDVGKPVAGDTVVVSGAAGSVGALVGQIAKIKGCRAIGIAGGRAKCDWLVGELGFDAAIDYKSEDVHARLKELCPQGINVYFDNVGGEILDAALANLAMRGRVVICGAIAAYNTDAAPSGPKNYLHLLLKRGRMEGFLIFDYMPRAQEAAMEMAAWWMAGRIKNELDVQEGLENAPKTLRRLFEGLNRGKQLLKIANP